MSEIECPYCGYSYEYDDVVESDEWYAECEQCHKEFKVSVEWNPVFFTDKIEENDDQGGS